MNSRRRCAFAIAFGLLLCVHAAAQQRALREPVSIMSINIRYGTAKDGDNHWSLRKQMLFDVVRERDADLVGLQEALTFQIDEIVAAVSARPAATRSTTCSSSRAPMC
jgi:hypothetical protein